MIWFHDFISFYTPFVIADYIGLKYRLTFLPNFAVSLLSLMIFSSIIPTKQPIFTLGWLATLFVATLVAKSSAESIIERENR